MAEADRASGRIRRTMMIVWELLVLVIAVIGVVLNNRKVIWCFPLWLISNTISAALHGYMGLWGLLARDAIFIALAIHGLYLWSGKKKG